MTVLLTERLLLREPRLEDAEAFLALFTDPVATEFIGGVHPAQPESIRAHWGRGYATEAALATRTWAREELGIGRLISLIAPANVRSQRVAERLGCTPGETVTPFDTGAAVVWEHPK
jgi:RimJ/RimL family protein N-acetyltransferase